MRPLNLASKPFRNEALPNAGLALAALVLAGVTVKHLLVVRALLPDRTSALHEEVRALDAEAARLRLEEAGLRGPAPPAGLLARWSLLKDLVDQRTFSWTRLLARLERVVPEGARISAIAPTVKRGQVRLDLSAQAQSTEPGFELLHRLQQHAEFRDPVPVSVGESSAEGASVKEFRYAMAYDPSAAPAGEAPASPAASAAPGGDEGSGEEAPR